jgi:nucleoside-diphosphate-sugar epimerase
MNNNKPVLVTGSSGFIGKQLVAALKSRGLSVLEFDQADGDIADCELTFSEIGHIFHLASQTYVPASWEKTFEFYRTNVLGTVNILELCRKHSCSLTYISSYVYGAPKYLPVDESHPIQPASPYNHSKLVAEDICRYYAGTFHVPVAVLRPVNIYGAGQRDEFLIPTILKQVMDTQMTYVKVMDTRPKRDYLYITDFIEALIQTMNITDFDIFNIGSGYSVSVEEIITTAQQSAGVSKAIQSENMERKNEIWDVYVDIAKFKSKFNWEPKISFEEGISRCISKYKLN